MFVFIFHLWQICKTFEANGHMFLLHVVSLMRQLPGQMQHPDVPFDQVLYGAGPTADLRR